MPASHWNDTVVHDDKTLAFGTDSDYKLGYNSVLDRVEVTTAAGVVVAYLTAANGIVFVGPVDASALKISGTALASTHLADWSITGKTNGYLVKWNSTSGKHEYVSPTASLGNYLATLAGVAGRTVVTGSGSAGAAATVDLASGVIASPGTYRSVTVDTYGRVTAGTNPEIALGTDTSGDYTASVAGTAGRVAVTGAVGEGQAAVVDLASGVATAGTYNSCNVDTYGRVTGGLLLTKSMVLTAQGATPAQAAGTGCAAPLQVETATNKINYWVLDFDPDTVEAAWWTNVILPADYGASTLAVTVYWTSAAGTAGGTVKWGFTGRHFGDDDALDQALAAEVSVVDTLLAQHDVHVATFPALGFGGTIAGRFAAFRLRRLATDAGDTLTGDARVLAVKIEYAPRVV